MKALVCESFGPAEKLVIQDVEKPTPGKHQVLLKILSCAINFPDSLIIQGLYQFRPDPPFSPGAEVCAVIEAVGEGVSDFGVGDRVIAGIIWGGLAEYAVANTFNIFHVPDEIPDEIAAATLMTYGTSYHALVDRAELQKEDKILVLGAAGGVGTSAIQIAKQIGAEVIAASSNPEKLDYCKTQGADKLINYEEQDLKATVKEMTGGKGVDVIYDPVGGKFTEPAFRAIARNGKHLVVGFANGEIPKIPLNLPLLKSASIVGVFWSSFWQGEPEKNRENIKIVLEWISEGKLKPQISKTYAFEEAANAIIDLEQRKVLGKAVVKIGT